MTFPAADLTPPPKPFPGDDIVTSEKAAAAYDSKIEEWGDTMYLQIKRLCLWSVNMGNRIKCPDK